MSCFRCRSAVPVVLILIFLPSVLTAQTSPPQPPTFQEEMVVTANLVESPADEVGSSVTVIGRDEIERRGATSVLDLLRTVPGLEVSQGGGAGTVGGVFLRGANSNHTLVLIDGVRVEGTSSAFDFSGLRADGVERIEILRGPQSTLYGSEAIGGVISITTLQGRSGFHAEVDGRAGSYDSHDLRASADGGGDSGGWDYSVALADQRTGGLSVASDQRGNVEKDPYTDRSGAARVGFRFLGDGRADVTFRRFEANAALDGFTFGVGPTDDPNATQERQVSVGSLHVAKPLASWWNLDLTVSSAKDATQGKDPDTIFNNYDFSTRLRAAKLQSEIKLGTGNTLVAGLASERREGRNEGSYDQSLDVDSAYLQENWAWRSRLFLTAGVRYDRYSRFGNETTWRTTGSWLAGPNAAWKVHGSYGTGFRGPSFDELFFPFLGNTALKPETSRGWDLGVERRFGNGIAAAGITWFSNRFNELITFDLNTFTFGNIQRASSEGIEATLSLQPRRDLALEASYTYDETEDRSTGDPLARRPRNRYSLLATWDASEKLRGTASVVDVEDRIDSDGTRMDAYTQVDLRIEYSLRPWLQPYLMIGNLLDQRYEEITGYTSAGFSALLGVRLSYH